MDMITDAFKQLNMLDEDVYDISASGIMDLENDMKDATETEDVIDVIDTDAEFEDDLEDSYVGKVILQCDSCKSLIFKSPDEITIEEDSECVNCGEECPYCFDNAGYEIMGQVSPFVQSDEDNDDTDEEETASDDAEDIDSEDDTETKEDSDNDITVTIDDEEVVIDDDSDEDEDDKLEEKFSNRKSRYSKRLKEGHGYPLKSRFNKSVKDVKEACKDGECDSVTEDIDKNAQGVCLDDCDEAVVNHKMTNRHSPLKDAINHKMGESCEKEGLIGNALNAVKNAINPFKEGVDSDELTEDDDFGISFADGYAPTVVEGCRKKKTSIDEAISPAVIAKIISAYQFVKKNVDKEKVKKFVDIFDNVRDKNNLSDDAPLKEVIRKATPSMLKQLIDLTGDKKLAEAFEHVEIETEDSTMSMDSDANGKVTVTTEPKKFDDEISEDETPDTEISDEDAEMIAPISDETMAEIEDAELDTTDDADDSEEEDGVEVDEFDEESFDEIGESYLKKVYENVDSFKTTKIYEGKGHKMVVEGVISFNNGNQKKTQFAFTGKSLNGQKARLIGENYQIANGKRAFQLTGNIVNKKFISESMSYNYRTNGQRMFGMVRGSK